jgi:HK97 family phage portal protein
VTWLQALRGESRATLENPTYPITSQALVDMLVGPKSDAGVAVNEKSAFGMPAVYRSVSLIAGTVASLPLHAYRDGDDDTRTRVKPTPRLIRDPHPDLTQFEWMELSLVHALSWGNTYYRKLRDEGGTLRELWPIEPSRVRVGRASDGRKVYAVDAKDLSGRPWAPGTSVEDERVRPFTDEEILHIPGMGYDGMVGMSPIAVARQGIGLAMAAEKFGAKLFGSGNLMAGVLSTEQKLDQGQADALKARWKAQHSGLDNAHDISVLGAGTKFQPISFPPEDVQFIESRKFQIAEIARMFGVPPHMLMDTEKSTSWGTGIEQQSIGFVVYTLRPWLARFEHRLSRLLPNPQYAKFTVEGLLRGDSAQRAAFYTSMWNIGAYSTNDIRRLEDQPPVPGGDVRYRPLNYGLLGESDPEPQPAAPAPTQTEA